MILGRREWPWIQSPHFEVINQGMNQGANIITKEQSSKLSVTNSSRLWMVSWISPETRSCTRSSVLRPQCQVNTQLRELRREFSSFQKKKCPEPQIHMTSASLSHTNLSSMPSRHLSILDPIHSSAKILLLERLIQEFKTLEELRNRHRSTLVGVNPLPHVLRE